MDDSEDESLALVSALLHYNENNLSFNIHRRCVHEYHHTSTVVMMTH